MERLIFPVHKQLCVFRRHKVPRFIGWWDWVGSFISWCDVNLPVLFGIKVKCMQFTPVNCWKRCFLFKLINRTTVEAISWIQQTSKKAIFDMVRTMIIISVSKTVTLVHNIIIPRKIADIGKTVNFPGKDQFFRQGCLCLEQRWFSCSRLSAFALEGTLFY